MRTRWVLAVIAACVLTACGAQPDGETQVSTSTEPDPPPSLVVEVGGPVCSETWVEGRTLPEDYDSCTSDDRTASIGSAGWGCQDGRSLHQQPGTVAGRPLFAFAGDVVTADSPDGAAYRQAEDDCLDHVP